MAASVECSGTSFSLSLAELKDAKLTDDAWLRRVQQHCSCSDFGEFCQRAGIKDPVFQWHNAGENLKERFMEACRGLKNTDYSVAVVFHGTASANIPGILAAGLDPSKRRGQAYGRGEYFGKDPATSSSYCRGGRQMCVFLVVVPQTPVETKAEPVENSARLGFPPSGAFSRSPPFEIVVVEQTHHQLPIGTLSFSSIDAQARDASRRSKNLLAQLNAEALEKEKAAKTAANKAKVIQLIIQREVELAGTIYNRHKGQFSLACKKEIAMYAYEGYDQEFLSYFFEGGLPKPKTGQANQEFLSSVTRTVESLDQDWREAVSKLDKAAAGGAVDTLYAQQSRPGTLHGHSGLPHFYSSSTMPSSNQAISGAGGQLNPQSAAGNGGSMGIYSPAAAAPPGGGYQSPAFGSPPLGHLDPFGGLPLASVGLLLGSNASPASRLSLGHSSASPSPAPSNGQVRRSTPMMPLPNQSIPGNPQNVRMLEHYTNAMSREQERASSSVLSSERSDSIEYLTGARGMAGDKSKSPSDSTFKEHVHRLMSPPMTAPGRGAAGITGYDGNEEKPLVDSKLHKLAVSKALEPLPKHMRRQNDSPSRRHSADDDESCYHYSTDDDDDDNNMETMPVPAAGQKRLKSDSHSTYTSTSTPMEFLPQGSSCDDESSYQYSSDEDTGPQCE